MNKTDDFARLTSLNSLLCLISGGSSLEAEQISAVLNFLRSETGSKLLPSDYDENVTRIVELHDPSKLCFSGISHWDMRNNCIDPLWLRADLLSKLEKLENESSGLLVISGLRQGICPSPNRGPNRREASNKNWFPSLRKRRRRKRFNPKPLPCCSSKDHDRKNSFQ